MIEELTEEQLAILKQQLEESADSLRDSLSANEDTSQTVQLDQQLMGRVSRIDAIQQQNMASAARSNQEQLLRKVLAALKRIDEDNFGYCQQCEEPIAFQRLKIKPEATLCIQCQSASEQH